MQISSINKFSLIDYPGKISCVIFTPGCNMRCLFCHNPEFVLPEKIKKNNFIKEKDFFDFLETRKWLLDWVSICWGEPSLQKDLKSFCKKIKNMWFLVKLDTNWRDPDLIKDLIEESLVDYIAMDIKTSFKKYSSITNIKEINLPYIKSINILISSNIDYEFRTTVIKWYHTKDDIVEVFKQASQAKNYFLQSYRPGNTLEKNFNWKSFTIKELEEFKNLWKTEVKNIWIRM